MVNLATLWTRADRCFEEDAMEAATPNRSCPDCRGVMQPIKLIDHTRSVIDTELSYTAADAQQGWFGGFPVAGTVCAQMCCDCGRILLYGEPAKEKSGACPAPVGLIQTPPCPQHRCPSRACLRYPHHGEAH